MWLPFVSRAVVRSEAVSGDPLGELQDIIEELPGVTDVSVTLCQALDVQPLMQQERKIATVDQRRSPRYRGRHETGSSSRSALSQSRFSVWVSSFIGIRRPWTKTT
jgi:hypothetical protein